MSEETAFDEDKVKLSPAENKTADIPIFDTNRSSLPVQMTFRFHGEAVKTRQASPEQIKEWIRKNKDRPRAARAGLIAKLAEIVNKYGIQKQYAEYRRSMDALHERAKKAG
jgi:hypothetical protein